MNAIKKFLFMAKETYQSDSFRRQVLTPPVDYFCEKNGYRRFDSLFLCISFFLKLAAGFVLWLVLPFLAPLLLTDEEFQGILDEIKQKKVDGANLPNTSELAEDPK